MAEWRSEGRQYMIGQTERFPVLISEFRQHEEQQACQMRARAAQEESAPLVAHSRRREAELARISEQYYQQIAVERTHAQTAAQHEVTTRYHEMQETVASRDVVAREAPSTQSRRDGERTTKSPETPTCRRSCTASPKLWSTRIP